MKTQNFQFVGCMADIQERLNAARSEAQQLEQQLRQAVDSRKDKSRKILIF